MKKSIVFIFAVFFTLTGFAQEAVTVSDDDTTKIRLGNKEVIIVENADGITVNTATDDEEKLKNGIAEFEKNLAELELKLDSYETMQANATTDAEKEQIEKEMTEVEKAIEALENGIEEIENELDNMEGECNEEGEECNGRHFDAHWQGLELGLNNFLNNNYEMQLPEGADFMELNTGKSWGFSLNCVQTDLAIVPDRLGIATGLAFEWNNYHFDNNINLYNNEGIITGVEEMERNYYKNSLNTIYLTAPLLLEFQIPSGWGDNDFYVNVGVTGGLKIYSLTKQFYKDSGDKIKNKERGDYQLSPFRYGLTARIGFGNVGFFANYSLVSLFESGKGPELYPFTIGITLN